MKTLADAWRWYQDAKTSLIHLHRLGAKHWLAFSPEANASLRRDEQFRMLEQQDLTVPAQYALDELDDLAIVVMFSVFEGIVRDSVVEQIRPEMTRLRHQSLIEAAVETAEAISVGSFYRVLAPFRKRHPDLTEEVDQVREYRNWVAHGKRKRFKNAVTPVVAYDRLRRFLEACMPVVVMPEEVWLAILRDSGE